MDAALKTFAQLTGLTCMAIGAGHALLGVDRSVPGAGEVSPTLESQEAFYNAVFVGYGLAWLRAVQDDRTDRVLEAAGVMGAGGLVRLIAVARKGTPHPFYLALTGVEFAVPAVAAVLARRKAIGRP